MRIVAIIAGAVALVSGSLAQAQTAAPATAPAPAVTMPSLISDVTIRKEDSPLVRAAKAAAAKRLRTTGVVINDAYVKNSTGRIIEANTASAPLPVVPDQPAANPAKTNTPDVNEINRAYLQQRQKKLKDEQARVAAEMEAPYGGDMPEDQAAQRMNQIQQEQKQNPGSPQKSQNVTKRP